MKANLDLPGFSRDNHRLLDSSYPCGFAAAQCGKARPFRKTFTKGLRLCLARSGGVASKLQRTYHGKAEPYRTVLRRSRSKVFASKKGNSLFTLYRLHHPQNITTQDLVDIAFRVPPSQKLSSQVWQIGDRLQIRRQGLHAIEVRANADVVDAGQLNNVIDMIDDARNTD